MANVAIFKPGETPQYLESVNTPDYSGPDVIINPTLTALVKAEPTKYWKRSGNVISVMSAAEKKVIDDAEKAISDTAKDNLQVDAITLAKALVAAGVITKTALVTEIKKI